MQRGGAARETPPNGTAENGAALACEDARERLEAHALGALDPDEAARLEAHLQGCADCRGRLGEYASLAGLLPAALAHGSGHRLPAGLKERLLRAALEPDAGAAGELSGDRLAAGGGGRVAPLEPLVPPPSPRMPAGRAAAWRAAGWRAASGLAAAGLAAVVAVSLVWSVGLGVALARERALRQELAAELAALAGQREVVLEVVDSRDRVTRFLRPPAGSDARFATAYGKVYTRPDLPHVVAMAGRLPAAPSGQAYHLWLRQGARTYLAGVLSVNGDGFGQLVLEADRPGPAYDAAWITLQPVSSPGGPSGLPAGPVVLRWEATTTN